MLLSLRTMERLADDARIPGASRRSFRRTAGLQLALAARPAAIAPTSLAKVSTFDCQETEDLPGAEVDASASTDPTVLRASGHTGDALRFLREVFGRDSLDGAGLGVRSSVHYSRAFSNAFWTGEQMVYGDGDGLILLDFTRSPEFVGHEVFHGLTQHTCGLDYTDEPGALNESISDVFGSVFIQWRHGQDAGQAHWRIGPDLVGPTAQTLGWRCVRDLADPAHPESMTRQPAHYADYIPGGDPHDNSGIPNRAFHRAALAIGGHSWERAGQAWFASLLQAHSRTTFAEFAALTVRNAARLFPSEPTVARVIETAWRDVGVAA
jgi:Zn-dependent metalloprotease